MKNYLSRSFEFFCMNWFLFIIVIYFYIMKYNLFFILLLLFSESILAMQRRFLPCASLEQKQARQALLSNSEFQKKLPNRLLIQSAEQIEKQKKIEFEKQLSAVLVKKHLEVQKRKKFSPVIKEMQQINELSYIDKNILFPDYVAEACVIQGIQKPSLKLLNGLKKDGLNIQAFIESKENAKFIDCYLNLMDESQTIIIKYFQDCLKKFCNSNFNIKDVKWYIMERYAHLGWWAKFINEERFLLHEKVLREPKLVELFVKAGADINIITKQGIVEGTPLHFAIMNKNLENVKLLITHGADVAIKAIKYNRICTSLHLAVDHKGNEAIVKFLIEEGGAGGLVNEKNDLKQSPLCCAMNYGDDNYQVIKLLIDKGADVNAIANRGVSILMTAVDNHCGLNIIKLCVEKKADFNYKNLSGQTLLWNAANQQWIELRIIEACKYFKFLIEQGVDVNIQDNKGASVLHYAANKGRFQFVQLLVEQGACVDLLDNDGHTPLYYAERCGYHDIVRFLKEKTIETNHAMDK